VGKSEGKRHLEFLNVDEDNIKKNLHEEKKKVVKAWTGLISGQVAGCCQNSNELSGFIKNMEFLNWLVNYRLLKKSGVVQSYLDNWKVPGGSVVGLI